MNLEAITLTSDEEEKLREYRNSDSFIKLVINKIPDIASICQTSPDKVKKIIVQFPRFANYNHKRVVKDATKVYGSDNEDRVKKAILQHAPFAALDHKRVVRQKARLGRLVGLSKKEVINYLLNRPAMAGYAIKRYLAALDVGRTLEKEGFRQDETMFKSFLCKYGKSPYVPGKSRKRISQVKNGAEPPLLIAMRKSLQKAFKKQKTS